MSQPTDPSSDQQESSALICPVPKCPNARGAFKNEQSRRTHVKFFHPEMIPRRRVSFEGKKDKNTDRQHSNEDNQASHHEKEGSPPPPSYDRYPSPPPSLPHNQRNLTPSLHHSSTEA
mmetsp:Transcript_33117/g.55787  ORF Transcript_33117/g.55787 Transcript_33117/m.55787 type:complete len:118 (+) Transcript_33117:37-390(+)